MGALLSVVVIAMMVLGLYWWLGGVAVFQKDHCYQVIGYTRYAPLWREVACP